MLAVAVVRYELQPAAFTPDVGLCLLPLVIFLLMAGLAGGVVKDSPPSWETTPPPRRSFSSAFLFVFFIVLNVNLGFAHVYTLLAFFNNPTSPTNFKFLEITLIISRWRDCVLVSITYLCSDISSITIISDVINDQSSLNYNEIKVWSWIELLSPICNTIAYTLNM